MRRKGPMCNLLQHMRSGVKAQDYPPVATSWTRWIISLQKDQHKATEMTPNFYTRLGKSVIQIKGSKKGGFNVDRILNSKLERETKASLITCLFSIGLKKSYK